MRGLISGCFLFTGGLGGGGSVISGGLQISLVFQLMVLPLQRRQKMMTNQVMLNLTLVMMLMTSLRTRKASSGRDTTLKPPSLLSLD